MKDIETAKGNLSELMDEMEKHFPGIRKYILDEQGRLRQHVNIFIDGELLKDRNGLSDPVGEKSEVYIMQALSGGII